MRRAVLLLVMSIAAAAFAADPNQKRGFNANDVYQIGEIDHVNLFNGNVAIRIPIGQTYSVGPVLQYQFALIYNSKIWDYHTLDQSEPNCKEAGLPCSLRYGIPNETSNAGFGWTVSLGRLFFPRGTDSPANLRNWTYVGADGSAHEFDDPIDPPDSQHPAWSEYRVAQTTDSSYLRLRRLSAERWAVDFSNGVVQEFDGQGNLVEMRDRSGNWVKVSYTATRWTITDGYGENPPVRTHYVNFLDKSSLYGNEPTFRLVVSSVELDAFDRDPGDFVHELAVYKLLYEDRWVGRGGGGERMAGAPSYCITAPFLTSFELPDKSSFKAAYSRLIPPSASSPPPACVPAPDDDYSVLEADSGVIQSLRLPTGGSMEWEHGSYPLNLPFCRNGVGYASVFPGVRKRTYKDKTGAELMKWTYTPALVRHVSDPLTTETCEGSFGYIPNPAEEFVNDVETWTGLVAGGGRKLRTRYYFSAYPREKHTGTGSAQFGFRPDEYGLPFTRINPLGSVAGGDLRLLSSEVFDCTAPCPEPLQRSYVLYERDRPDDTMAGDYGNDRVAAERVVHLTDTGCSGVACFTDQKSTEWDGYGHYRKTLSTSNYPGAPARTTFTDYRPDSVRWLLNVYLSFWVTQTSGSSTAAAKTLVTYDPDTGLTRSQRTLKASGSNADALTPSSSDLLAVWCRDSNNDAGQRGYVTSERYFGGDSGTIPAGDPCLALRTDGNYFIEHDYDFNGAALASHVAQYAGTSHSIANELFDAHTGLVRQSKDPAGIATSFEYDLMGRLTWVKPQTGHGAWTQYEYLMPPLSTSGRAEVSIRQRPNGSSTGVLTAAMVEYDDLGRVLRERKRLKNGFDWSSTETRYDAAGRKERVSITDLWTGSEPSRWTTTTWDVLNRPTSITAPDSKKTTFSYAGARLATRTFLVGTASGETPTSVTEEKDPFGNLVRVREADTSAEWAEANYKYNLSDKLTQAAIEGPGAAAQNRTFEYDSRGFLTSETHPESGTTTYRYDSRGHMTLRSDARGSLSFSYDAAERLKTVMSGSTILKEFAHASSNSGSGDYSAGKLTRAVRHNYQPVLGGDIVVTETYRYRGTGGALSSKETSISTGETFIDAYAYDELGAAVSITYPQCSGCGTLTQPSRTVTSEYVNGYLSAVGTYANSIEYHPNGMLKSIRHRNAAQQFGTFTDGPLYEQLLSADGMPRPGTIQLSNACTDLRVTAAPASATINAGQSATLSVTITGATSYQWYQGDIAITNATGLSITVTPQATAMYWVRGTNATCTIDSPQATVTVNNSPCTAPGPTIRVVSATPSAIQPGGSADIAFELTGTPNWHVRWSDGAFQIANTPHYGRRVENIQTTTVYTATVMDENGCPGTSSGSALVTVASTSCTPQAALNNVPDTMDPQMLQTATVSLTGATAVSYAWTILGGTAVSAANGSSFTFRSGCGPTTITVNVTASCGTSTSVSKTIEVIAPSPVLSAAAATQGGSGTLTVGLPGAGPWSLTWSDGWSETASSSSHQRVIANVQTTRTYSVSVVDAHGCQRTSNTVTLSVTPPAPVMLGAAATASDRVQVTWSFSGSADRFEILRFDRLPGSPAAFRVVGTAGAAAMAYADIGLPANTAALYRVVAVKDGVSSAPSAIALATTSIFTDSSIPLNVLRIRAIHITELRAAVNAVRSLAGLGAAVFSDSGSPQSLRIRSVHLTELRSALDGARSALGLPPIPYEQSSDAKIRAAHIVDLRRGVE